MHGKHPQVNIFTRFKMLTSHTLLLVGIREYTKLGPVNVKQFTKFGPHEIKWFHGSLCSIAALGHIQHISVDVRLCPSIVFVELQPIV